MEKPKLLMVGAFAPSERNVYGGLVTSCRALVNSSFPQQFNLTLIDSTQVSNPPPGLLIRALIAIRRFSLFVFKVCWTRPDAVLVFSTSGLGLLEKGVMGRFSQLVGARVLMFPRGGNLLRNYENSKLMRACSSIAFKKANKVLCQGKQWQSFVTQKLRRRHEDAPIVENWTASKELLKIGSNRTYDRNEKTPLKILFVGWLDREKGVMDILQALSDFSRKGRFQIEFVGEGNVLNEAKDFVGENGLEKDVVFSGWLEGPALCKAYQRSEVFLLPSWMEGLPNAMIEAMAAGLPPVVSSVGNIPSVIEDRKNGLLVEPKTPGSVSSALNRIMDNELLLEKLGKNAYEFARDNFSTEVAVKKLSSVIHEVLAV